jgi:hypothetical protein
VSYLPGLAPVLPVVDDADGDCWFTPRWLLAWLGPVALDPCWCEASAVQAAVTLDLRRGDDGLSSDWSSILQGSGDPAGIVFVNPPFSACGAWLAKCAAEARATGRVVVALVPALPGDGPWHASVWPSARWVGFLAGRIEFVGVSGKAEQRGRGHALVVFGPSSAAERFVAAVQSNAAGHVKAPVWVTVAIPRAAAMACSPFLPLGSHVPTHHPGSHVPARCRL